MLKKYVTPYIGTVVVVLIVLAALTLIGTKTALVGQLFGVSNPNGGQV